MCVCVCAHVCVCVCVYNSVDMGGREAKVSLPPDFCPTCNHDYNVGSILVLLSCTNVVY